MDLIYLDHNATTPLDPEAFEAMRPWFTERFGNASSAYALGHLSDGAVVAAREQVAALVGCWEAVPAKRHLVTTAVEHPAVRALVLWWKGQGGTATDVGVDGEGRLDLAALEAAVRPDTALVIVMAANNESGVLFPVAEAAGIAKSKGAPPRPWARSPWMPWPGARTCSASAATSSTDPRARARS